ncbi:MAG: hypothetical protein DI535_12630 [Citrobacter freundii]|nr:MAG: hypothetical protein DI535_12630 [Citrobacter freundii]
MGLIHAEVLLINDRDISLAKRNIIGEEEIRQINVNMLVDTGSLTMCINENIQSLLNLPVVGKKRSQLADGSFRDLDRVSSLKARFENQEVTCDALVLPGDSEPLLGAIPLEGMDVFIDQKRQELKVTPEGQHNPNFRV